MTLLFFLKPIYRPIPGVTDDRRALLGDPEQRKKLRKRRRRRVYRIIERDRKLVAEPESLVVRLQDVRERRLRDRKKKTAELLALLGALDDD